MSIPFVQTMYTVPSAATASSGEKESLVNAVPTWSPPAPPSWPCQRRDRYESASSNLRSAEPLAGLSPYPPPYYVRSAGTPATRARWLGLGIEFLQKVLDVQDLGLMVLPISVVWIVGMQNAVNFIDGDPGTASPGTGRSPAQPTA
jgi:hypothetical protein